MYRPTKIKRTDRPTSLQEPTVYRPIHLICILKPIIQFIKLLGLTCVAPFRFLQINLRILALALPRICMPFCIELRPRAALISLSHQTSNAYHTITVTIGHGLTDFLFDLVLDTATIVDSLRHPPVHVFAEIEDALTYGFIDGELQLEIIVAAFEGYDVVHSGSFTRAAVLDRVCSPRQRE